MSDFVAFLLFGGALGVAVGIGEAFRSFAKWKPESSRRVVHLLAGLLVVFAVPLFSSPTLIYVLALLFVGVNLVAVGRGLLPGMHSIGRKSWGTVTFPLALIFALFTCWTLAPERIYILQIGFLVLAFSDPLASFVGTRLERPGTFVIAGNTKSVAGTMAFFLSAWILVCVGLWQSGPESLVNEIPDEYVLEVVLVVGFCVALVSASVELLAGKGWDNLAIVVAIVVLMTSLFEGVLPSPETITLAIVVALFALGTYILRVLNASGSLAAGLLGYLIMLIFPFNAWLAPAVVFFLVASALSIVGKKRKAGAILRSDKSSRRDSGQVLANGGVGGALAIAYILLARDGPHSWVPFNTVGVGLYWAFVGSFAAAAADTFATEIGTYFRWPTWRIVSWKRVSPGESGGVSFPGFIGALLGAASVVAAAWFVDPWGYGWTSPIESMLGPMPPLTPTVVWIVAVGGILGSLIDSILGATVQAKYRDSSGRLTERSKEDGHWLPLVSGYRWMTNDRVNLACTTVGALIPLSYFLFVPHACPWCY